MNTPPPCKLLRNRHTQMIHAILRQDPNGDVVLWSDSGKFRITQDDMQEHWEAFDGCPVCGGTGRVWNMPDDWEEDCKVCTR